MRNCVFLSQDRLFACPGITAFCLPFLSKPATEWRLATNLSILELVLNDDAGEYIDKVEPRAKRFKSCNLEQLKDILGSWVPQSTKNWKMMRVIYPLISVTAVDL